MLIPTAAWLLAFESPIRPRLLALWGQAWSLIPKLTLLALVFAIMRVALVATGGLIDLLVAETITNNSSEVNQDLGHATVWLATALVWSCLGAFHDVNRAHIIRRQTVLTALARSFRLLRRRWSSLFLSWAALGLWSVAVIIGAGTLVSRVPIPQPGWPLPAVLVTHLSASLMLVLLRGLWLAAVARAAPRS